LRSWDTGLHQRTAGLEQAGRAHGEFVDRGLQVAVLVVQHLALLGELDLAVHRAGRLRQDRLVGRTAAAADGAAAAVEQPAAHAALAGDAQDLLLRLVQVPARGEDAAVLAGIGIAEHDLLLIARGLQQRAVGGVAEQREHLLDVRQVLDGLEQRADADLAEPAVVRAAGQAGEPGQEHHLQHVTGGVGHGDDVVAEGLGADLAAHAAHDVEHRQRFAGEFAEPARSSAGGAPAAICSDSTSSRSASLSVA
jgi:hypothetical protein